MRAEAHRIDSPDVVIPESVQPVVDLVPDWLRSEARVVTGLQFRADCFREVIERRSFTTTHREIRLHNDPALVIDGFVLAGWGEKEHNEEVERRAQQASREQRKREVATYTPRVQTSQAWSIGFGVLSVTLLLGVLFFSPVFAPFAAAALGAAVWQGHRAVDAAARLCRTEPTAAFLTAGVGGFASLWLGAWLLALGVALLWWPPVVFGAVFCASYWPLVWLADRCLPEPVLAQNGFLNSP